MKIPVDPPALLLAGIPPDPAQAVVLELHGILQRGGLLLLNGSDLLGGRRTRQAW